MSLSTNNGSSKVVPSAAFCTSEIGEEAVVRPQSKGQGSSVFRICGVHGDCGIDVVQSNRGKDEHVLWHRDFPGKAKVE